MFGKHFQSTYTGSMFGAGPVVFATWGWIIAHTVKGRVEINPVMLAPTLGTAVESIESALQYLCAPDPRSRSKEHEGRRLIREGQFQYLVPTHEKYQLILNNDDRREYFRQKKAESRARKAGAEADVKASVKDSQGKSTVSTHPDPDQNADAKGSGSSVPTPITATGGECKSAGQVMDGILKGAGVGVGLVSLEDALTFARAKYGQSFPEVEGFVRAWYRAKVKDCWQDKDRRPIVHWKENLIRYVGSAWHNQRLKT